MNYLFRFLKWCSIEVLIVLAFTSVLSNYIGYSDTTIKADGIGYYDYLPSTFIHEDMHRPDPIEMDSSKYERILATEIYIDYKGKKLNKYPCGTALLQSPFFITAHVVTESIEGNQDGYQENYHFAIYMAALFYLFLALIFLKHLLQLYEVDTWVIVFCQVLLTLGTCITNYLNFEASYSHVYSLFAVTAFLFFAKSYFKNRNFKHFIWTCVFLGLVVLIRQINVLIVLFIPFLAASFENLKEGLLLLFKSKSKLILGLSLFLGIVCIQCIFWYVQVGEFIVYSYQGETFHFLDPHFFDILFSYQKGLFVYTPVLLIAFGGVIWFGKQKDYYQLGTWLGFFIVLTYVLSSWWCWYYGASFGQRAFIEFFPIFFIPLAIVINKVKLFPKLIIVVICIATVPVNIIQTYQYKEYILHWDQMTKEGYWKVFLETEDQFKGLVWKPRFDFDQFDVVYELELGDIPGGGIKDTVKIAEFIPKANIPEGRDIHLIRMEMENAFADTNTATLTFFIADWDWNMYFWNSLRVIHYAEDVLGKVQIGEQGFMVNGHPNTWDMNVGIEIEELHQQDTLKDLRIQFMSRKSN